MWGKKVLEVYVTDPGQKMCFLWVMSVIGSCANHFPFTIAHGLILHISSTNHKPWVHTDCQRVILCTCQGVSRSMQLYQSTFNCGELGLITREQKLGFMWFIWVKELGAGKFKRVIYYCVDQLIGYWVGGYGLRVRIKREVGWVWFWAWV